MVDERTQGDTPYCNDMYSTRSGKIAKQVENPTTYYNVRVKIFTILLVKKSTNGSVCHLKKVCEALMTSGAAEFKV